MTGGIAADTARLARGREARAAAAGQQINVPVSQVLDGTLYQWRERYSIRVPVAGQQDRLILVTVRIFAQSGDALSHDVARDLGLTGGIPAAHAPATLTEGVKMNWRSRILERWKGAKLIVKNPSGDVIETYNIAFEIEWVDNSSQADCVVFAVRTTGAAPPDGTVDTMYWGVGDGGTRGAAIAHEFGHLLGNPDEYGGTCIFNGRAKPNDPGSVMCDETHGAVRARHYYSIGRHAAAMLPRLPAHCFIVLDRGEHPVAPNHPW